MRRRNPFLAKPPKSSYKGRTMGGVTSHPGFHTSQDMDVTMPYALSKVVDSEGLGLAEDYPVILGLDMDGLEFFSDYDADKAFEDVRYSYRGARALDRFDDFMEYTEALAEEGYDETRAVDKIGHGEAGTDILFARASAFNDPLAAFADFVLSLSEDDQQVAFQGLRDNVFPSAWLAEALRQRRYVVDVEESRLKAVYYMRPVWEMLYYPYNIYSHKAESRQAVNLFIASLEDNGFTVYTAEDAQEGELVAPKTTLVWGSDNGNLQYHGTSYKNLLAAAPFLKRQLPTPPSPYGRYVDFVEDALDFVRGELGNPEIDYRRGIVISSRHDR